MAFLPPSEVEWGLETDRAAGESNLPRGQCWPEMLVIPRCLELIGRVAAAVPPAVGTEGRDGSVTLGIFLVAIQVWAWGIAAPVGGQESPCF